MAFLRKPVDPLDRGFDLAEGPGQLTVFVFQQISLDLGKPALGAPRHLALPLPDHLLQFLDDDAPVLLDYSAARELPILRAEQAAFK